MPRPPRRVLPLVGSRQETLDRALQALGPRRPEDVLWVSRALEDVDPFEVTSPAALRRRLGGSTHAVVLDGHDGLHADVLAACPGFLLAGGTLVLRLPPEPVAPVHLAVHPSRVVHRSAGTIFEGRLRAALGAAPRCDAEGVPGGSPPTEGTPEQQAIVDTLLEAVRAERPSLHALLARRGRGKSTALGQVLGQAAREGRRVALCAPDPTAGAVAAEAAGVVLPFLTPEQALAADPTDAPWDVLAIDEAARCPVPWLRALARHHGGTLLFATTTGGYEGTGQGFVLRFLASLRDDPRPLHRHHLHAPIRWDAEDPLETWLDGILLDHATPGTLLAEGSAAVRFEHVAPDRLASDDLVLQQVHGLLQHAHYRTTPADLQRLLDGPNLYLHAAFEGPSVVAVNLVAVEGGLPPADAVAMRDGGLRIRGHALPDTLVCHMGALDAALGCWIRSVRLAVHPERRRRGLARALADHVHRHHLSPARRHGPVDGFGTLFGAVPHVVRLRQGLGYRLVRLSASRGSRTGEPSAVMVRPVSDEATQLVDTLAGRTARDLDLVLAMLQGDGELPLSEPLVDALRADLPPPLPLDEAEVTEAVHAYVNGPRPLEAAATALRAWLPSTDRTGWTPTERQLAQDRLFDTHSWTRTAQRAGLPHARAAMRALKRACRRLTLPPVDGTGPPPFTPR